MVDLLLWPLFKIFYILYASTTDLTTTAHRRRKVWNIGGRPRLRILGRAMGCQIPIRHMTLY